MWTFIILSLMVFSDICWNFLTCIRKFGEYQVHLLYNLPQNAILYCQSLSRVYAKFYFLILNPFPIYKSQMFLWSSFIKVYSYHGSNWVWYLLYILYNNVIIIWSIFQRGTLLKVKHGYIYSHTETIQIKQDSPRQTRINDYLPKIDHKSLLFHLAFVHTDWVDI